MSNQYDDRSNHNDDYANTRVDAFGRIVPSEKRRSRSISPNRGESSYKRGRYRSPSRSPEVVNRRRSRSYSPPRRDVRRRTDSYGNYHNDNYNSMPSRSSYGYNDGYNNDRYADRYSNDRYNNDRYNNDHYSNDRYNDSYKGRSPPPKRRHYDNRDYKSYDNRRSSFNNYNNNNNSSNNNQIDQSTRTPSNMCLEIDEYREIAKFEQGNDEENNEEMVLQKFNTYLRDAKYPKVWQFFLDHQDEDWFRLSYNPDTMVHEFSRCKKIIQQKYKEFTEVYQDKVELLKHDSLLIYENANNDKKINGDDKGNNNDNNDDNNNDNKNIQDKGEDESTKDETKMENNDNKNNIEAEKNDENDDDEEVEIIPDYHMNCIHLGTLHPKVSIEELERIFKPQIGYKRILIGKTRTRIDFRRPALAMFDSKENCHKALKTIFNTTVSHGVLYLKPKQKIIRDSFPTAPAIVFTDERIAKDLENCLLIVKKLDNDYGIEHNFIFDGKLDSIDESKQRLSILIQYLRNVHNFCYYCVKRYRNEEHLLIGCGDYHSCKSLPNSNDDEYVPTDEDKLWVEQFEKRVENYLSKTETPSGVAEDTINNYIKQFKNSKIQKLEEQRYRCILCTKLFRGQEFVEKHLSNKHIDAIDTFVEQYKKKIFYYYYVVAPNRPHENNRKAFPGFKSTNRSRRFNTNDYHNNPRRKPTNITSNKVTNISKPTKRVDYDPAGRKVMNYRDLDDVVAEEEIEIDYGIPIPQ